MRDTLSLDSLIAVIDVTISVRAPLAVFTCCSVVAIRSAACWLCSAFCLRRLAPPRGFAGFHRAGHGSRPRAVGQFVCASAVMPAVTARASTSPARIEVWDLITHSIGAHMCGLNAGVPQPHGRAVATTGFYGWTANAIRATPLARA